MDQMWQRYNRSNSEKPLEIEGFVSNFSENISQSGLLCRTSKKIDEMTLLSIKFQLPKVEYNNIDQDTWIECSGVVVRCEKKETNNVEPQTELPYEVAILFDRISEEYRSLLAKHVDYSIDGFV